MSAFFTAFAPLPIILLYVRRGFGMASLAVVSNALVVAVTNGLMSGLIAAGVSASLFLVLSGTAAVLLPYFLLARAKRPDVAVVSTVFSMMGFACILGAAYWALSGQSPIAQFQAQVGAIVDLFAEQAGSRVAEWELPPEEFKRAIVLEFPSVAIIMALVVCWANLMILLRFNPNGLVGRLGVDAEYTRNWKSPEWMVWPAIVAGGALLLGEENVSPWGAGIALNLFKVLMAVYGIHGLSVLSFLLDGWKVQGLLRSAIYVVGLLFLWPLVLGIGFFDLWFDFRGKFRQSLGS